MEVGLGFVGSIDVGQRGRAGVCDLISSGCVGKKVSFCPRRCPRVLQCSASPTTNTNESKSTEAAQSVIEKALSTSGSSRPSPRVVTDVLMNLKRLNVSQTENEIELVEAPSGLFQLVFATGKVKFDKKLGAKGASGYYVPSWLLTAQIGFSPDSRGSLEELSGVIENTAQIGLFKLRFSGVYIWSERASKLSFNFYNVQVSVGRAVVFDRNLRKQFLELDDKSYFLQHENQKKLPFFIFNACNETYASAQGRGGGFALWKRIK